MTDEPLPIKTEGGFAEQGADYAAFGSRLAGLMTRDGDIAFDRVAERFGMSKAQIAETAGLSAATLQRASRATAARTRSRITEMLEIVARVSDWAGGERQAMGWYRSEPLPAFGGRTAESLVKDGKAGALRDHLDHLALGGYA